MKLHILAIAAHPDDAELACSGTLMQHVELGYKVGIVDLTLGELGTRGTPALRLQEAAAASEIMDIDVRENLRMADGFFENNALHQLQLIKVIRKYQPDIVLANAIHDRHPDHGRGAQLAVDSCFKAGLRKIETLDEEGKPQEAWRPKSVYHYIQDTYIIPDFVVDISPFIDRKTKAMRAYGSQFFNEDYEGNDDEPTTYISDKKFIQRIVNRASALAAHTGFEYVEGFTVNRTPGVQNLFDLH